MLLWFKIFLFSKVDELDGVKRDFDDPIEIYYYSGWTGARGVVTNPAVPNSSENYERFLILWYAKFVVTAAS